MRAYNGPLFSAKNTVSILKEKLFLKEIKTMLIIAGKATIMTLLTIIAVAVCVIVIAAATVSCNAARRQAYVEQPKKVEQKGEEKES